MRFLLLVGVFAILSSFSLSSSASALGYNLADYNVVYESANEPQCAYKYNLKSGSTTWSSFSTNDSEMLYNPTLVDGPSIKVGIEEMICRHSNGDPMTMRAGDIVVLDIRLNKYIGKGIDHNNAGGYLQQFNYLDEQGIDVMDFEMLGRTDNVERVIEYWRLYGRMSSSFSGTPYWGVSWKIRGEDVILNPINAFSIFTMSMIHLRPKPDVDYSGDLTDLKAALNTLHSDNSSTLGALNNLRSDLQEQTEQQHDDYENEVQREEDKQDELEEQAEDVSISANAVANPFANLFNSANCASLPTLASWLNVDPSKIQVCSPYPQQFRPIIEFVSSAIVVGLLIRVYYKQLKGGFSS